jgi:hypothetical protein
MRDGPSVVATTQKEHNMNTTHTRTRFFTATIGAGIAAMAAPALLVLSVGTAQAVEDPENSVGLPHVEQHPDNTWGGFNDPGASVGVLGPNIAPPEVHPVGGAHHASESRLIPIPIPIPTDLAGR